MINERLMAEYNPEQQYESEREQIRDDMTGELVPADEMIQLYGYRVGAEGKQILMDRLQKGDRMSSVPERWPRLGSALVDWLILIVVMIVIVMLVDFLFGLPDAQVLNWADALFSAMNGVLGVAMLASYFALLHGRGGETVGKGFYALRVVNTDASPLRRKKAWLRASLFPGLFMFSSLSALLVPLVGHEELVSAIAGASVWGVVIIDVGMAMTDSKQQRTLHDRLAGTRVIWQPNNENEAING